MVDEAVVLVAGDAEVPLVEDPTLLVADEAGGMVVDNGELADGLPIVEAEPLAPLTGRLVPNGDNRLVVGMLELTEEV